MYHMIISAHSRTAVDLVARHYREHEGRLPRLVFGQRPPAVLLPFGGHQGVDLLVRSLCCTKQHFADHGSKNRGSIISAG